MSSKIAKFLIADVKSKMSLQKTVNDSWRNLAQAAGANSNFGVKLFALNTLALFVLGSAGGHKQEWSSVQTTR